MNFFGMGPMELAVILVIALIVFGPGKLPEIGAAIGRGIRDFRAATRELTSEFEETIREVQTTASEVEGTAREVGQTTQAAFAEAQETTRAAFTETRPDQAPAAATAPVRSDVPPVGTPGAPSPVSASPQQADGTVPALMPTKEDPLADLASVDTLLDGAVPAKKASAR